MKFKENIDKVVAAQLHQIQEDGPDKKPSKMQLAVRYFYLASSFAPLPFVLTALPLGNPVLDGIVYGFWIALALNTAVLMVMRWMKVRKSPVRIKYGLASVFFHHFCMGLLIPVYLIPILPVLAGFLYGWGTVLFGFILIALCFFDGDGGGGGGEDDDFDDDGGDGGHGVDETDTFEHFERQFRASITPITKA